MKNDSSKKMLFEMMSKVGGMPLNENFDRPTDILINEIPNIPYEELDKINNSLTIYLNDMFRMSSGKAEIYINSRYPVVLIYRTPNLTLRINPEYSDYVINIAGNQYTYNTDSNQSLSTLFDTIKRNIDEIKTEISLKK